MAAALRIVQVNPAYDAAFSDAERLLDRYTTLTGWSRAVTAAGGSVSVILRFNTSGDTVRDGVRYQFVSDGGEGFPAPTFSSRALVDAVTAARPDVVHVNGLMFPAITGAIRRALPHAAIVVQDHAGYQPPAAKSLVARWRMRGWRDAFEGVDAWSFTAQEHAEPWRAAGILRHEDSRGERNFTVGGRDLPTVEGRDLTAAGGRDFTATGRRDLSTAGGRDFPTAGGRDLTAAGGRDFSPASGPAVLEIVEASTTITPLARTDARALTGVTGSPALLWVGRLNENKDPMTAVAGVQRFLQRRRAARFYMIYTDRALEAEVRDRIERDPATRDQIRLVRDVPHDQMAAWMSAADLFISASHREGSGYALLEGMACGAIPVVTDIPPFRVIAGDCGRRWHAGNALALSNALDDLAAADLAAERACVLDRFARELSWETIGRRTLEAYSALAAARRGNARR